MSDGFEGTNNNINGLISTKIDDVSSFVHKLLTQVEVHTVSYLLTIQTQFSSWVNPSDKRLMQRNEAHIINLVVALHVMPSMITPCCRYLLSEVQVLHPC